METKLQRKSQIKPTGMKTADNLETQLKESNKPSQSSQDQMEYIARA